MPEIADVARIRSITLMPLEEVNNHWKNFKVMVHREPHPDEEPTRDQLTVVKEVLACGAGHVDFALFGADQQRTAKAMRGIGMIHGPGSKTIHQEFKGPPDYRHYRR